jgi:hypothetical protein
MRKAGWRHSGRALVWAAVLAIGAVTWVPWAGVAAGDSGQAAAAGTLPARLSDADFWTLVTDVSEPGGFFQITDNYTSNEFEIGQLFTMLRDRKVDGGVYLGVGPEQNLTYIAAIRPQMAFIVDIRRQAVMQHLMFKAMFELSRDRADFIAMLFAKPRPGGLDASTSIQKMWDAYFAVPTDTALAAKLHDRVVDHLTKTRKFTLTAEESSQLDSVLSAFVQFGPNITTRGSQSGRGGNNATFADLTGWSADATGTTQSFLSTENHFRTVKTLHERNLIVPVSGDFAGPKTFRAIGAYLAARRATVSAVYVSNVEQYLFREYKAQAFYDNVAALPLAASSVFIRPYAMRQFGANPLCGIPQFLKMASAGRVPSNRDATACTW